MCNLWQAIRLAQKVGEKLGASKVLQRTMPQEQSSDKLKIN